MYSRDELKQLKREFWISFSDYCLTIPQLASRKSQFMLYNTKLKGVELKFDATRNGAFVIMEINHTDPDRRFELFEHAQACRLLFEQELGNELIWELCDMRPEGKEVSRIYIQKMGMDMHRRDDWPQFYEFMAPMMLRMEKAFRAFKETL